MVQTTIKKIYMKTVKNWSPNFLGTKYFTVILSDNDGQIWTSTKTTTNYEKSKRVKGDIELKLDLVNFFRNTLFKVFFFFAKGKVN